MQFTPEGIRLIDHGSYVTYRLPVNLQQGELSMMVLNADEGNPGDKSKIFSMQEGPNVDDITTDGTLLTRYPTSALPGRPAGARDCSWARSPSVLR